MLDSAQRANTRLPDLKVFICGGASVPPSLIRAAAEHFTHTAVTRVYGSSEVPVITVGAPNRTDLAHAAQTDGKVGIAEVKLVGPAGNPAAQGEVRVRGPQMLLGYLHPKDEANVFDAEGYFRTGDLAHWTDQQYLTISGRLKDIIIRNGENISPKEVEDVLSTHPDIAEVSIVGIPDDRTGERACAVIVARGDAAPDLGSLQAHLRSLGVATFKMPEQVEIWSTLPKNDAGKVLKHQVRARLLRH
jgi:acyl-CoA synthetase (AMP-forming)/AMP-acid ligase II